MDRDSGYIAYVEARAVRLRRIAYQRCGRWHGAEDLTQDAPSMPSDGTESVCGSPATT